MASFYQVSGGNFDDESHHDYQASMMSQQPVLDFDDTLVAQPALVTFMLMNNILLIVHKGEDFMSVF